LANAFERPAPFVLDTPTTDIYTFVMTEKDKYVYDWPRPMVTVDAVVFALDRGRWNVLLIKRRHEPFRDQWAIPGGFIGIDEELEDAVRRELREETGLTGVELQQLRTFGRCGRDPRGRQITIVFIGITKKGAEKITGGDDAAEARWFDIEKLPANLAFDHDEVLKYAVSNLKKTCLDGSGA
jgi:8-oxo-dGTP diphosphatase